MQVAWVVEVTSAQLLDRMRREVTSYAHDLLELYLHPTVHDGAFSA